MRSWAPLLLLIGCGYTGLEDRWADTVAACDPPDPYLDVPYAPDTSWMGDDCRDRVFADLGVVEDSFDEAQLDCLLLGTANLMARDLGSLQDLEEGDFVRRPFLRALRQVRRGIGGHDEVARLLYDFVAYHVEETRIDAAVKERGARASFDLEHQSLLLSPDNTAACSADYASLIVHEASHAITPDHVACPWDLALDCDETWHGSYGFEAATAQIMWLVATPDQDVAYTSALVIRDLAASRVLQE